MTYEEAIKNYEEAKKHLEDLRRRFADEPEILMSYEPSAIHMLRIAESELREAEKERRDTG